MKITYDDGRGGARRAVELEEWLQPTYTGSEQGSVEQLEAKISVLEASMGSILAALVTKGLLDIHAAESMAGKHEWYIKYRYNNLRYEE